MLGKSLDAQRARDPESRSVDLRHRLVSPLTPNIVFAKVTGRFRPLFILRERRKEPIFPVRIVWALSGAWGPFKLCASPKSALVPESFDPSASSNESGWMMVAMFGGGGGLVWMFPR